MKLAIVSIALIATQVSGQAVRGANESRHLSGATSSDVIPDMHWLVCGDSNRDYAAGCKDENGYFHPTYPGLDGDTHEVRCCSATQVPGSKIVSSQDCPGIYGLSEINGECLHAATYEEAETACASVGARLCTQVEVANRCTEGTGCNHDADWVWTSTEIYEDTLILPTDGYHYVGCGNPTSTSAADCKTNGAFHTTARVSDTERHEVRCCSADKLDWFDKAGARKQSGCAVYGISNLPTVPGATASFMCFKDRPQWEAEAICSLNGLRLCSDVELAKGCTRGSGCGFDANNVWSDAVACEEGECESELHAEDLQGCFNYDLKFKLGSPFSIEFCHLICKTAGYAYAALKHGDQCTCGDNKDEAKLVPDSNCDRACKLGPGGTCGGSSAISLFATGATPSEIPNYEELYMGCYKDPTGELGTQLGESSESIIDCVNRCSVHSDGFALAGLGEGGKCYCGKERLSGQSTDCLEPCASGKGLCGGTRGRSVYRTTNGIKPLQSLLECKGATTNWWGDPHMITFDGLRYNCQGIGHFVITTCEDYELQAIFKAATGSTGRASVTHGIAARYKNYPKVQVSIGDFDHEYTTFIDECPVHVFVGGQIKDQTTEMDENISIRPVANGFEIQFPNDGPALKVKVRHGRGCLVDVDVCVPEDCMDSTAGLLGTPNGNIDDEWMFYNGTTYFPRPNDFKSEGGFVYCTEEWCVHKETDSLFTYEGEMGYDDYDECAREFPGEIDTDNVPDDQKEKCQDAHDPDDCIDEAAIGGNSAIDETLDNDLDLDPDTDPDPDDPKNPDCPLDVELVGQTGQGFQNWPVKIVSQDEQTATIEITSPMSNMAIGEYFYYQYPVHSGSTDACEAVTGIDKEFSVEVTIACLHSAPFALIHLYVVDGAAYGEGDTASVDECCHPPEEAELVAAVEYSFQIACVPRCPTESYL